MNDRFPAPPSARPIRDSLSANPVKHVLLPAIGIGAIAGIDNIAVGLAIASLLFAGPLVSGLEMGVGVVLLSGAVLALYIGLRSTQPNAVALVQETSVAILASTAAIVAVRMSGPAEAKVATVFAILGISTIVTGFLFWLTGKLRLGGLAGVLPYPVIAGFLAGSGWLLLEGGATMLTGGHSLSAITSSLDEPEVLARVIPALVFSLVMVVTLRRVSNPMTAPLLMLAAGAAFYVAIPLLDISMTRARTLGWLQDVPGGVGIALPTPNMVGLVDWGQVVFAAPAMFSAAALSVVGLLLNTSGLELAIGRDLDANSELRSSGRANMLVGCFGGPSGYVGLSMTLLAQKMGCHGRAAGVSTALVLATGLFFARPIVNHLPVFLTAGLVMYMGMDLLYEWFIAARRRLPFAEWLIVVVILSVIVLVGFMEGLAVGLLVSIALFIYNYARLPVIRLSATGKEIRSMVDRSPSESTYLSEYGDVIEVRQLQGYLFFGTADRLVSEIRNRIDESPARPLLFLVLDFRHVSGVDSAATTCFVKLKNAAEAAGVSICFSHLGPKMELAMRRAGFDFDGDKLTIIEHDVDHALKRCEEELLSMREKDDTESKLVDYLGIAIGPHPRLEDLIQVMTEHRMEPGDFLIHAGADADDVFFLASGRVKVQITLPDGRVLRLRAMTGGAIVGEVALYLGGKRSADVIVEIPSLVLRLDAGTIAGLEASDAELAILAHRLLAHTLAEKLTLANRLIQASQR